MRFSGMRDGGGAEAAEGKEQALCLALRATGKDPDSRTTEAIKAYMDPLGQ